jgi:two-component system NarL family response regulator
VARIRLLLADDNPMMAAQIQRLLESSFDVVGVVASGEELEAAYELLVPEVIVTDIVMPGSGGLSALRRLRERYRGVPIVLLSVIDSSHIIKLGLSLGALGFVVKEDAADELVAAVDAALQGRQYISRSGRRNLA